MPDQRKHRGPHPDDARLFAPANQPTLQTAVADLSWLLSHGYTPNASSKLVGDRYQLTERQRLAVLRCSCSDESLQHRVDSRLELPAVASGRIDIDGFNLLTTIEAALSGGVILAGRDGCYRDMASMHGSYRKVLETEPALQLIGATLQSAGSIACHWYLDRPVSNSGRLAQLIREVAETNGWSWTTQLEYDVDGILASSPHPIVTADGMILDRVDRWINLARTVIEQHLPHISPVTVGI